VLIHTESVLGLIEDGGLLATGFIGTSLGIGLGGVGLEVSRNLIGSTSEIFLGTVNAGLGGVGGELLLDLVAERLAVCVRHVEASLNWIELICRLYVGCCLDAVDGDQREETERGVGALWMSRTSCIWR